MPDDQKRARADRFRELREKLWGSQEEAAELAGVNRVTLSKIENGDNLLSTMGLQRPFVVLLGVRFEDFERYLAGEISLPELHKLRREPDGRRVLDPDDPDDWAAIVRAIGKQNGKTEELVEAFIATEMKRPSRLRIGQIEFALDALEETLAARGETPASDKPPFLSAKRKRS